MLSQEEVGVKGRWRGCWCGQEGAWLVCRWGASLAGASPLSYLQLRQRLPNLQSSPAEPHPVPVAARAPIHPPHPAACARRPPPCLPPSPPPPQLSKLYACFASILEAYEERRAERMKRMQSEVRRACWASRCRSSLPLDLSF